MRETAVTFACGPLQLEGLLWLPEESPAGGTPARPAGPYVSFARIIRPPIATNIGPPERGDD